MYDQTFNFLMLHTPLPCASKGRTGRSRGAKGMIIWFDSLYGILYFLIPLVLKGSAVYVLENK